MKRLVCEMCGSNDMVKDEGLFVCQSCGTKYTVEEARKLLIDEDGMVNVRVDRSKEMDNRLPNAVAEYKSGHHERAITLFNEVLNIDYENVAAIIYKAAADGWLSTLDDNRLISTAKEMCRAIGIAKSKTQDTVAFSEAVLPALQEMAEIGDALVSLCMKEFDNVRNETGRLMDLAEEARKKGKHYMMVGPVAAASPCYQRADMYARQAREVAEAGRSRVSDNQRVTVAAMHEVASAVMDELKDAQEVCETFMSAVEQYASVLKRVESSEGNAASILQRKADALKSRTLMHAQQKKAAKIEAYWEEHAQERAALLQEEAELQERIAVLDQEQQVLSEKIDRIKAEYGGLVPAEKEQVTLKQKRKALLEQISRMSFFKIKEKRQLNAEAEQLASMIDALDRDVKQQKRAQEDKLCDLLRPLKEEQRECNVAMEPLNKRLAEIKTELTKER